MLRLLFILHGLCSYQPGIEQPHSCEIGWVGNKVIIAGYLPGHTTYCEILNAAEADCRYVIEEPSSSK